MPHVPRPAAVRRVRAKPLVSAVRTSSAPGDASAAPQARSDAGGKDLRRRRMPDAAVRLQQRDLLLGVRAHATGRYLSRVVRGPV